MTQKEKIEILKSSIVFLYEKEGRPKSYIAKLLEIDRKTLIAMIKQWGLNQATVHRLSPSNQKFLNKHRLFIKSKLDKNISQAEIAKMLGVSKDYIRNIIHKDEVLKKANEDYSNRRKNMAVERVEGKKQVSSLQYDFEPIEGEEWKEILGYDKYFISNMGRAKRYAEKYNSYFLLNQYLSRNNRLYVDIRDKRLQVSRLVGFAFVEGHSNENNTIDHKDGNCRNNNASNLEWVSQKENNTRAYKNGREVVVSYQKNGKFKKIILNDTYEFKTIVALSKFLGKSSTQVQRYLSGETPFDGKIELVY